MKGVWNCSSAPNRLWNCILTVPWGRARPVAWKKPCGWRCSRAVPGFGPNFAWPWNRFPHAAAAPISASVHPGHGRRRGRELSVSHSDAMTPQGGWFTRWLRQFERRGIRMARDLNNEYMNPLTDTFPAHRKGELGDVAKVNCATCHQGAYKPLYGAQMAKDFPELQSTPAPAPVKVAKR